MQVQCINDRGWKNLLDRGENVAGPQYLNIYTVIGEDVFDGLRFLRLAEFPPAEPDWPCAWRAEAFVPVEPLPPEKIEVMEKA